MPTAFILIKTLPGHERDVYYRLKKEMGISELHPVIGQYNLIAKIKAEDFEKLGYMVVDRINKVGDISQSEMLTSTAF